MRDEAPDERLEAAEEAAELRLLAPDEISEETDSTAELAEALSFC